MVVGARVKNSTYLGLVIHFATRFIYKVATPDTSFVAIMFLADYLLFELS